jgi:hypothetical protein
MEGAMVCESGDDTMKPLAIAALFVAEDGCYSGLPNVDLWGLSRDARFYRGPYPIVAHPPCQRWGRYWHGSPRKPHQYTMGDDDGCFAAALRSLVLCGGVLEHPAYSHAWDAFGLPKPDHRGAWRLADGFAVAHVEQGHYGHMARKATWLLAHEPVTLPPLIWGPSEQRLSPIALERHGYEKARRSGVMAYVDGKDKAKIRGATPIPFRDLLISMARTANNP